jgi:hypothetical protein
MEEMVAQQQTVVLMVVTIVPNVLTHQVLVQAVAVAVALVEEYFFDQWALLQLRVL